MDNIKFIDIGVNLNDQMFQGIYNDKNIHPPDLSNVIERAKSNNVEKMINLSGSLGEIKENISLLKEYDCVYHSAGYHPTRCNELENGDGISMISELINIVRENKKIIAIGELGLDFDRTHFCDANTQIKWFRIFLENTKILNYPYIFHMRNASDDFTKILKEYKIEESIVHCFTGNVKEAEMLLSLGLSIGFTGCSLKNIETLEAIKITPIERIFIETDSPWCTIRPGFAGYQFVKFKPLQLKPQKHDFKSFLKCRQEPGLVRQIYEAIAGIKGIEIEDLSCQVLRNFSRIFKS